MDTAAPTDTLRCRYALRATDTATPLDKDL